MGQRLARREFVKYALTGASVLALGLQAPRVAGLVGSQASAAAVTRDLVIGEALVEMVDLTPVYMWTFGTPDEPRFPGPTLTVMEGDTVELRVHNTLDETHAFAVDGTSISSGQIAPGATATVRFTAPAPGTYIYLDPLNAPANRLMGLVGVMVVLPTSGNTPYRNPPASVQRLFDDLGSTEHFPGDPWALERTKIWHIHTIDPVWHTKAQRGEALSGSTVRSGNLPRYFLLNGKSGYFASHDHDTAPSGRVGQPHLIRIVNTGMTANSLHIHGNHVYLLANNGTVRSNVPFIDSWRIAGMERADWLLPFIYPPDMPHAEGAVMRSSCPQELEYVDPYGIRQSPIEYPMHCHMEPSQTAAGGNYPGGLVTHWEITGDVDGVDFPRPANDQSASSALHP